MGLMYRKRVGRKGWALNLTQSGVSASKRIGRVSVSSRGSIFARIARGLTWRGKL